MHTAERTLYKVLADNQSCHGGRFDWTAYLPQPREDGTWTPGDWTPPVAHPCLCFAGYHLTPAPMRYPKVGMDVFRAEGRGQRRTDGAKTVFTSVRLLQPTPELVAERWQRVEALITDQVAAIPWHAPEGAPERDWIMVSSPAAWRYQTWLPGLVDHGAAQLLGSVLGRQAVEPFDELTAMYREARLAVYEAVARRYAGDVGWCPEAAAKLKVCELLGAPFSPTEREQIERWWSVCRRGFVVLGDAADGRLCIVRPA